LHFGVFNFSLFFLEFECYFEITFPKEFLYLEIFEPYPISGFNLSSLFLHINLHAPGPGTEILDFLLVLFVLSTIFGTALFLNYSEKLLI
jgi:hypothetical protein